MAEDLEHLSSSVDSYVDVRSNDDRVPIQTGSTAARRKDYGSTAISQSGSFMDLYNDLIAGTVDDLERSTEHRLRDSDRYVLRYYRCIMKICGLKNMVDPINNCRVFFNVLYTFIVFACVIASLIYYNLYRKVFEYESYDSYYIWGSKLCVVPILGYLLVFVLIRLQPIDHVESLAERVFLHMSARERGFLCPRTLLLWIKCLIITGLIFFTFLGVANVVNLFTSDQKWVIFIYFFLADSVACAVIINYTLQCLLLIFLSEGLRLRILLKRVTIKDSKQEILDLQEHVHNLRNHSRVPMIVIITNMMETIVRSYLRHLNLSSDLMTIVVWAVIITTPIVINFRLGSSVSSLTRTGAVVHSRPFGFADVPDDEVNSFLLFMSTLRIRPPSLLGPAATYIVVDVLIQNLHYLIEFSAGSHCKEEVLVQMCNDTVSSHLQHLYSGT